MLFQVKFSSLFLFMKATLCSITRDNNFWIVYFLLEPLQPVLFNRRLPFGDTKCVKTIKFWISKFQLIRNTFWWAYTLIFAIKSNNLWVNKLIFLQSLSVDISSTHLQAKSLWLIIQTTPSSECTIVESLLITLVQRGQTIID